MFKKIAIILSIILPLIPIGFHIFYADEAFSLLTYTHTGDHSRRSSELINTVIQGKENYLAIVSIPLLIPEKAVEGDLTFKIKRVDEARWLHIATYSGILAVTSDQLFGFPPIPDSKSASYNIQVVHDSKNQLFLKVDPSRPLKSKYKMDKTMITASTSNFIEFIYKKTYFSIQNNPYFLFMIFIYWLPALIFILYFTKHKESMYLLSKVTSSDFAEFLITQRDQLLLITILFTTLVEIIAFPQYQSTLTTIILIALWMSLIVKQIISALLMTVFTLTLVIISQISFHLLFLNSNLPQKSGSWVLIFLILMVIRNVYLLKQKESERKDN